VARYDFRTTRLFVAAPLAPGARIALDQGQVNYLVNVLRHRHGDSVLVFNLRFPNCWNGRTTDSPDHKRHMAYSLDYVCPATHPVKVPLIRALIRYPITDGRNVELASGGQLTGHADFVNAWNQRALATLVDDCFHMRPCRQPPNTSGP